MFSIFILYLIGLFVLYMGSIGPSTSYHMIPVELLLSSIEMRDPQQAKNAHGIYKI